MRFGSCNGGAAVRQSIETAVRNASPLPAPPEPRAVRARGRACVHAQGVPPLNFRRTFIALVAARPAGTPAGRPVDRPDPERHGGVRADRHRAARLGRHGAAPYDVAATVQADLERSGRFRPLPRAQLLEQPHAAGEVDAADWRMLKVDYVLVGRLSAHARRTLRSALRAGLGRERRAPARHRSAGRPEGAEAREPPHLRRGLRTASWACAARLRRASPMSRWMAR